MDDGTDVTAAQGARFMAKQAFITADDAFDSETLLDGIPRDAADSRIHTRSVAATGQYSDLLIIYIILLLFPGNELHMPFVDL